MTYAIEYQDAGSVGPFWHPREERYASESDAQWVINKMLTRGAGPAGRGYRVAPAGLAEPQHPDLVRLADSLRSTGAVVAFWIGRDGVEALLFEGQIAVAVPGGPIRRGVQASASIEEAAGKLVAEDLEAMRSHIAEQEREHSAAQEHEVHARERAAAEEREREHPKFSEVRGPTVDADVGESPAKSPSRTWPARAAARVAHAPRRATTRRVVQAQAATHVVVASPADDDGDLAVFAKLLRCGPWRAEKRSSDLLSADGLPPGAHAALLELAGVANPTARVLGNVLKRFHATRIEGIPARLARRFDGHGFAIWQVVAAHDEVGEASTMPTMAELLCGALVGMGYRDADAADAVAALGARIETEPVADLVRRALRLLPRRPMSDFDGDRNDQ